MAQDLTIPQGFGPIATAFQGQQAADDLAAGIAGGFGLIKYKGKVWSLQHRGVERQLMRPDGDGPQNSIEIVILKASPHVAKIYYEQGYIEGSTAAPDCFSSNGVVPEVGATKKQSQTCALCPKNAWGSRITPGGKQGKACSDSKRLAVVPLGDLKNEMFGGPMLLRVPAASLQELATFGNGMAQLGYPYYAIGVRVAFDTAEAFPKFKFSAIRPLSNEEAAIVVDLQKSPQISRILAEGAEHAAVPVQTPAALPSPFEQPPVAAPAQLPAQPPVQVAAPVPAPVGAPTTGRATGSFGGTLAEPVPMAGTTPAVVHQQPVTVAATPASAPAPTEGGFDAALDAQLNDLLPE